MSRRAIQKARKKLLDSTGEAVAQSSGAQLVMASIVPEEHWPEERRIDPLEAACRAGAIEEAVAGEVRKAVVSGNVPLIKVLTSAWGDVCKCVSLLEDLAEKRVHELKWRTELRQKISDNFEGYMRTHGSAYVRNFFPSKSEENQSATDPMLDEEIERWNRHQKEVEASQSAKK